MFFDHALNYTRSFIGTASSMNSTGRHATTHMVATFQISTWPGAAHRGIDPQRRQSSIEFVERERLPVKVSSSCDETRLPLLTLALCPHLGYDTDER